MTDMTLPSRTPFMYISHEMERVVRLDCDRRLRVMIHGAYNAMGIIGTEVNGIGIAVEPVRRADGALLAKGQVLVRGALAGPPGAAPTKEQLDAYAMLTTGTREDFVAFVKKYYKGFYTE